MIKAFFYSFLLLLVCVAVIYSGILDILSSKIFFYAAWIFIIATLIAAWFILGNPLKAGKKDDERRTK